MVKSEHHKPTDFIGLYFVDEGGSETGQIIAQVSDGYYLVQFDCIQKNSPPPRLEVLSSADFNRSCDCCGARRWLLFPDVRSRKKWISWLNTPDPANDKMGNIVLLKPKPDQRA
jgi:hypothetical protein